MQDYLFRGDLSDFDPKLEDLAQIEAERQYRRLILIPSESTAPLAVRNLLASAFQNVYAEGYPPEATRSMSETDILDFDVRLAEYRRYSDPRYYKGVEYADFIEALARRRCAEAFSNEQVSPEEIFVNVQALSGAPANNAVYHALIEPGDTILGMNLLHGGHLTHGSPVNRSGKLYHAVHYTVDRETERIDYDAVQALATEHRPKVIVAGYSSYPWSVDWSRFREIADSVSAYLLADIAHVAGLVVAGVFPSPVGIADVVTFTTHKSLCGPRGATILTTQHKLAKAIDRAVFPGEQGGPHINTIAAQALAFKLATTDQFKQLQQQIVVNAKTLADTLEAAGFRLPFGGTDTHMLNIDCKSVVGADGTPLSGDQAARILDLAGIVTNRNTIPGDRSAFDASGVRMGTPWITQRGFKEKDVKALGKAIAELLHACRPYSQQARKGPAKRAKVDFETLNRVKIKVRELAQAAGYDGPVSEHGYPHFYYLDDPQPQGDFVTLELAGEAVEAVLRWLTDVRPAMVTVGQAVKAAIYTPAGQVQIVLSRSKLDTWRLSVASEAAVVLMTWLRDLSDGFVLMDEDLHRKAPGPFIVRHIGQADAMPKAESAVAENKPWYLGAEGAGEALPAFEWVEPEDVELRRTALFEVHKEMGGKIIPFAGWEMPVWYTSVLEEHLATREAAGLFDVSHMGVYQVEGPQAAAFLDSVVTNDIAALAVGESCYTQFLDPIAHVIDDTMVYRRREGIYLVVVNAANDDKDWAWLNAVRDGSVCVDNDRPWARVFGYECTLRNLRDPKEGVDMRVDIALQGPKSREILLALGADDSASARLKGLPWAGVLEGVFGGIDLVVSRTGYTGERVAYELFVHPDNAVKLWKALVEVGEPMGMKPVGLGARDSLRTEAGLPLYGHEMAGQYDLGVGDAGFGAYVKTYKPWFIGRKSFLAQEAERTAEVVRFRFDDKGVRMAHTGDPVADKRGRVIGYVTSCAVDAEGYLLGQAYLEMKQSEVGAPIAVYQSASEKADKAPAELEKGDRVTIPTPATVLTRFPG